MSNADLSNRHSASLLSDSQFTELHESLCFGWFHASRKRLPGFIIITKRCKGIGHNQSRGFSRAVDGNWGSWERWGQVTATCGTGMRERLRRCDNPRPNFCGRSCSGPAVDTELYDTGVACDRCSKSFCISLQRLDPLLSQQHHHHYHHHHQHQQQQQRIDKQETLSLTRSFHLTSFQLTPARTNIVNPISLTTSSHLTLFYLTSFQRTAAGTYKKIIFTPVVIASDLISAGGS